MYVYFSSNELISMSSAFFAKHLQRNLMKLAVISNFHHVSLHATIQYFKKICWPKIKLIPHLQSLYISSSF